MIRVGSRRVDPVIDSSLCESDQESQEQKPPTDSVSNHAIRRLRLFSSPYSCAMIGRERLKETT
jgi:hypothetical protein